MTTEIIVIPEISDQDLITLAEKIKPMMQVADIGLHYINIKDWTLHQFRKTSFIWDKKSGGRVRRPLQKKESITTYHKFAAPIFFKPSIAEVLAQLSLEQRKWCKGFILEDDLTVANVLSSGFHVTTTHLYG